MDTCKVCNKEKLSNFSTCRYHNMYGYKLNLKVKCFDILGWECKCCGENNFYHLEIDHIKPCMGKRPTTMGIYVEIIRNPTESILKYQIYCATCNKSKHAGKTCTVDHLLKNRGDFIRYLKYIGRYT